MEVNAVDKMQMQRGSSDHTMRVWFYNNGGIGLICLHSHYNLDICILQFDNQPAKLCNAMFCCKDSALSCNHHLPRVNNNGLGETVEWRKLKKKPAVAHARSLTLLAFTYGKDSQLASLLIPLPLALVIVVKGKTIV